MNLYEYQDASRRTLPAQMGETDRLVFALGLCGESGEVGELVKKHIGHGKAMDYLRLEEELGDALWYVAAVASAYGLGLDTIATRNVEKLAKRYPEGFTRG
jgi:NTP pyrophosphatase (non-canonical NTP hydrolase)